MGPVMVVVVIVARHGVRLSIAPVLVYVFMCMSVDGSVSWMSNGHDRMGIGVGHAPFGIKSLPNRPSNQPHRLILGLNRLVRSLDRPIDAWKRRGPPPLQGLDMHFACQVSEAKASEIRSTRGSTGS